jgi:prepilin-type N-terminal cleavage/methylation domain-containing protein/prepilin-type processing-associated H-X9-DG protein
MKTSLPKHRRGFTLVEILAVVAIIGLLAGIIGPGIMAARRSAQQGVAMQNLKGIAQACVAYYNSNGPITDDASDEDSKATSVVKFAEVLAKKGSFGSAAPWYIESEDNGPAGVIPKMVIMNGSNTMTGVKPTGWAVVVNAKKNKWNRTTYPLLWTRGLTTEGSWNEKTSPWSGEGGHIAFGDGHAAWYAELKSDKNKLIKAEGNDNSTTSSYQEAIGTESSGGGSSPTRYEDSGS